MARYLYLARHGEAELGLTEQGREQALLLGQRLKDVPISGITHGPLERTTETARLIAGQIDVPVRVSEAAGDSFLMCPHGRNCRTSPPICDDFPTPGWSTWPATKGRA